MKVIFEKVATDSGFVPALLIIPQTVFEREYIKRHNFPKMHDGTVVICEMQSPIEITQ